MYTNEQIIQALEVLSTEMEKEAGGVKDPGKIKKSYEAIKKLIGEARGSVPMGPYGGKKEFEAVQDLARKKLKIGGGALGGGLAIGGAGGYGVARSGKKKN